MIFVGWDGDKNAAGSIFTRVARKRFEPVEMKALSVWMIRVKTTNKPFCYDEALWDE